MRRIIASRMFFVTSSILEPVLTHPGRSGAYAEQYLAGELKRLAARPSLAEVLGCELLTSEVRLASAPGPRCNIRVLR